MAGDRDVMLATLMCRQPHMAPGLTGNFIPEPPHGADQFVPAQVAGQLHAVMTSSRTNWRRIGFGCSPSS